MQDKSRVEKLFEIVSHADFVGLARFEDKWTLTVGPRNITGSLLTVIDAVHRWLFARQYV